LIVVIPFRHIPDEVEVVGEVVPLSLSWWLVAGGEWEGVVNMGGSDPLKTHVRKAVGRAQRAAPICLQAASMPHRARC
jgi:hypothetical protein